MLAPRCMRSRALIQGKHDFMAHMGTKCGLRVSAASASQLDASSLRIAAPSSSGASINDAASRAFPAGYPAGQLPLPVPSAHNASSKAPAARTPHHPAAGLSLAGSAYGRPQMNSVATQRHQVGRDRIPSYTQQLRPPVQVSLWNHGSPRLPDSSTAPADRSGMTSFRRLKFKRGWCDKHNCKKNAWWDDIDRRPEGGCFQCHSESAGSY